MSLCEHHMGIAHDDLICPRCATDAEARSVSAERERCAKIAAYWTVRVDDPFVPKAIADAIRRG